MTDAATAIAIATTRPVRSPRVGVVIGGDDDAAVAAMTTPPLHILDVPLVDDAEIVVVAPLVAPTPTHRPNA
jgi:hypothetical protein